MFIKANCDLYGKTEYFTSSDFRRILELIDGYVKTTYRICEIRRDDIDDKNGRIDIEVEYLDGKGHLIHQKLLILNDELIDGKAFHARHDEWYPREQNNHL